jgi:tetratricopeptide (TPR) repeat protein
MIRRYFPSIKHISIFALLLLISGCSLWTNFTTYFNLYFNTKTLFDEAEEEILAQKRDLFSTEPLIVSGAANTKLVKVIEKCSKILQFHSTSSYVDNALMMLGKSFYYQKNFQKAKRKFEELLITEPDEDTRLEADYWIARCNMSMRDYFTGLAQLEDVRKRAVEENNLQVIRDSYIEEIIYRISQDNYSQAVLLSQELLPFADSRMKSQVYYELGKLYIETGDLENAVTAYENVFEYSPDFDLEIAASIKYAKTLRDAGKDEEALSSLRTMRRQDKFQEKFSEIDLETAVTLVSLERFDEALEQFSMVDTTYRGTTFSAIASYYKGRLYEDTFKDFDSASVYYQKAFTSNPPMEYDLQVREKNQLFNRYFGLRRQIDNYDRQLFYAENPEIFVQDSIEYVQDSLKILSDYLEQQELFDIWSNVFAPDPQAVQDSLSALDSIRVADSIHVRDSLIALMNIGMLTDTNEVNLSINNYFRSKDSLMLRDSLMLLFESGILTDTNQVNEILTEHFRALDDRDEKLGDEKINNLIPQPLTGVNLDTVKFKRNPPRLPVIPLDSVKYIISKAQLELGNLFLAEMDVGDSAYYLYTKNIERFPESDFYPNTLYALGSYFQTIENNEKADSLFKYIYDNYKSESIVNAAADKLNLPLVDLDYDPAKTIYSSAESQMIAGNFDYALKEFLSIYRMFPESPISPKALYAGGWILEKDLRLLDSAAVVYDTLVTRFASSIYSREVARKLSGYKQELARIKKEQEDTKLMALKENGKVEENQSSLTENDIIGEKEDVITHAFNPDLDELVKNEEIRKTEEKIPDTVIPDPVSQKPKLEALWNPRKPR